MTVNMEQRFVFLGSQKRLFNGAMLAWGVSVCHDRAEVEAAVSGCGQIRDLDFLQPRLYRYVAG